MFGKQNLPYYADMSLRKKGIPGNSSLPSPGPLSDVNLGS